MIADVPSVEDDLGMASIVPTILLSMSVTSSQN